MIPPAELFRSPHRDDDRVRSFDGRSLAFLRRLPGYHQSPLVRLPELADRLGLRDLAAKLEVDRFGLTSFKAMGVQWALAQCLDATAGGRVARLITASDGNHGHAVARAAREAGLPASIYLPRQTPDRVLARLRAEGADVVIVPGTYDDSVDAAYLRSLHEPGGLLLSDTSADPEDRVAEWVIQGYGAIFAELDTQLDAAEFAPDMVLVQVGIGGLAAAAARYFRRGTVRHPELIAVESVVAASAQRSAQRGSLVRLDAAGSTVMAGINAGLLSAGAWTDIKYGFDSYLAIDDSRCGPALRALRSSGVRAGPTGAAGMAGLFALASTSQPITLSGKRALVIITEGRPRHGG
ncbi:pyridoxal-phosphate dependent enzyme [Longimicrobium terrae]|uniref:Diaminopropionate ammonia-lyase n=1 Tax=Longimicrobium terrae TaxID=1639882 RepID=A0A841H178_9BACT|nr:pyridoxal-phosphate dependent enzyme [Longimicrobium terrae]MBB4637433.1 diaminopropionate ammonia-lyase [Longimicrobium terrae]MBB6071831.1 diaminopropionate ammonia-lyase [Longimicrobium terrae]NNC30380.1 pyridoxal-phosphate dependent enzyme [Longimicrobium terrae]